MSYKCAHCGAEVEADDTGLPPEDIRNAILADEGRYGVELPSVGTAGNATMLGLKTMRRLFGWSLDQLAARRKNASDSLYEGTQTEAHWVASELERDGVAALVARKS